MKFLLFFITVIIAFFGGCAPSIDNAKGGCYLINDGHKCDCALTTDECSDVLGIWTDRCDCGASSSCGEGDAFTHDEKDEVSTTTVNATCEEEWVYLNLSDKTSVSPNNPEDSQEWDLAFQRFKIKSNGGISGTGNVQVAVVTNTDFNELEEAPSSGYLTDAEDSDDEDEDPDYPFLAPNAWYSYDEDTHILTPKDQIYVVQSISGDYFKIQLVEYYDDAGTSGYPQFNWASVAAPTD